MFYLVSISPSGSSVVTRHLVTSPEAVSPLAHAAIAEAEREFEIDAQISMTNDWEERFSFLLAEAPGCALDISVEEIEAEDYRSPISSSADAVIRELDSHIGGLLHEVGQMRGLFSDDDGNIAHTVEEAQQARAEAARFLADGDVLPPMISDHWLTLREHLPPLLNAVSSDSWSDAEECEELVAMAEASGGKIAEAWKAIDAEAREPLPMALAMIDRLISYDGDSVDPPVDVRRYARGAKNALGSIVAAAVDLHATMGEAIETHIYDFDNGDEQPADCQFHAAMERLQQALGGDVANYFAPVAPLPFTVRLDDGGLRLLDANGSDVFDGDRGGMSGGRFSPTGANVRNLQAMAAAANATPLMAPQATVVVVLEGGMVTQVFADRPLPARVVVVDYDVEGAGDEEVTAIPQDTGKTADAYVSIYDKLENDASADFWRTLREIGQ